MYVEKNSYIKNIFLNDSMNYNSVESVKENSTQVLQSRFIEHFSSIWKLFNTGYIMVHGNKDRSKWLRGLEIIYSYQVIM